MKATIVQEGSEFVLYGELNDEIGHSTDAELVRTNTKQEAQSWAAEHGYTNVTEY